MITKKILLGLIVITAVIFLFAHGGPVAILAVVFGLTWLVFEFYGIKLATGFFLAFVGLAIVGSLDESSIVFNLLGLSTALAAWDLSRFHERIAQEMPGEKSASLETRHLLQLIITVCAGFFFALLPTLTELSLDFGIICLITFLIILALRKSISMFALFESRN